MLPETDMSQSNDFDSPIPEGSPAVSMSTDLKKLGGRIDFDVVKYNQLLDEQGVKPDRSSLHIEINSIPPKSGLGGEYSKPHYDSKLEHHDPTIRVFAAPYKTDMVPPTMVKGEVSRANKTLMHETKHYLQDQSGDLLTDVERQRRLRLFKAAGALGTFIITGLLVRYSGYLPAKEASLLTIFDSPFPLMIGSYAGKEVEYRTRKEEKEARGFEKTHNDSDILTVSG